MSAVFRCPDCQVKWSRKPLTQRQGEIMHYLRAYHDKHGWAPSLDEIAERFGWTSLATVWEHLTNLEIKGWIHRGYNQARAISLVEVPHGLGCTCESCLDESFGPMSDMPPDAEEQRDSVYGDLGVPTVGPER
jgi:SOS-response transcriptional repressor LexA